MSWGSGANAWGPEKEDKFTKPNHWDGMLEVGDADKIKMKNKRRISSFKKGGRGAGRGASRTDSVRSPVRHSYCPGEKLYIYLLSR